MEKKRENFYLYDSHHAFGYKIIFCLISSEWNSFKRKIKRDFNHQRLVIEPGVELLLQVDKRLSHVQQFVYITSFLSSLIFLEGTIMQQITIEYLKFETILDPSTFMVICMKRSM